MRVGVLFSGGKDSTLALHLAVESGLEVSCLISIFSEKSDSYMFHYPNVTFTKTQSLALEIPLLSISSQGKKEKELEDMKLILKRAITHYGIEGIVTGAVRSVYQATRIQRICHSLSLEVFNPIWLSSEEDIYSMLFERGFRVVITRIAAYPLSSDLLGREITPEVVNKLKEYAGKYGVSMIGEGGELETFVLDAPLFRYALDIARARVEYRNYEGMLIIEDLRMVKK